MSVRLRQAVIAAAELEPVAGRLREELGLGEPYSDPGVGLFGLHNAVFALGDQFLEVIAPQQPDTAVHRWLARHGGDGGYMVMFQVPDVTSARARARAAGVRGVWEVDLDDIAETHLHPADMRGAIVAVSTPKPTGSWRWGGPDWEGKVGAGAPGELRGLTVAVPEPEAAAARWAEVLGADAPGVEFAAGQDAVTTWRVAVPGRSGSVEVGGVQIEFEEG